MRHARVQNCQPEWRKCLHYPLNVGEMPIFGRFWPFLVIEKAHLQSQIQNHPRAQWRGVSRGEFDAMFSEVEVTSLSSAFRLTGHGWIRLTYSFECSIEQSAEAVKRNCPRGPGLGRSLD